MKLTQVSGEQKDQAGCPEGDDRDCDEEAFD